ncbi:MAG: putative toxin-antitoxin system toxin component, PIN family [Chroococcidiopsidaceae cyanobacterium CP_BM_ER_R8_30]|nr:putative toxin-antitoxin system toxin component, PIN family [Chroococcidiopsidaceae cyanobacterium CP_BM_ER_R8_30]
MIVVRLVLDTDAIVAAMRSPRGASAALLVAAQSVKVTLVLSVPLAMEYEAICSQPEHQTAAGLSVEEALQFVTAVIALAEPISIHYLWRPKLRDPNDEMVLEVAVNGRADAIVTFNKKDYGCVPNEFGVEVLLPAEAIRRVYHDQD